MGKGDKKSRRGKIIKGSYGVRRTKKKVKELSSKNPDPKKETKKKAPVQSEKVEKEAVPVEEITDTAAKPKTKPKDVTDKESDSTSKAAAKPKTKPKEVTTTEKEGKE